MKKEFVRCQPEIESGEKFGERLCEGDSGPLLRHHHARPHARQGDASGFQCSYRPAQAFGAKLHYTWSNIQGNKQITDVIGEIISDATQKA